MTTAILEPIVNELEAAAAEGIDRLAEVLAEKASEVTDPVATFLLNRVAGLVEAHGEDAVDLARTQFFTLVNRGKLDPAAIRKLPLHERGPLIAASLQKEYDAQAVANAVLVDVGTAFAVLFRAGLGRALS